MINRIKNNIRYIFARFTLIVSIVFALISGIQMFIDWDNIGIDDVRNKLAILLGILMLCGIISIIWGMFFANKATIYSKDDVEIEVMYGDLMKIAFPKKKKKDKIVVIAVNRCNWKEVIRDMET